MCVFPRQMLCEISLLLSTFDRYVAGNSNRELVVGLLDCEVVDGVSEKVFAFSVLLRCRFDTKVTLTALLIGEIAWCQTRFVVAEISPDGYNCIRFYA